MFPKINILEVIKDHLSTIRDYDTGKTSVSDAIIFALIPALFSFAAIILVRRIDGSVVGILITAFSIFTALLLNLLMLIFAAAKPEQEGLSDSRTTLRHTLLKELFANVSFGILTSILITVLLVAILFACGLTYIAMVGAAAFLITNFFFTLLMILKRVHILLKNEF
jgi:hypothetical protein